MNDKKIKEIRKRWKGTLPGHWNTAYCIAHARTDIPALLAHIESLNARIEELETEKEETYGDFNEGYDRDRDEGSGSMSRDG